MEIENIKNEIQEKVNTCEKNYIQCAERNDFDNAEKWEIMEEAFKEVLEIIGEAQRYYWGVNC